MSEVSDAFRRIEPPNVRTNTSVQPFHCALRSFTQACLQRMKQQLYRVKVWRIRRQVAEACTNSLDQLLHTSDLVERDVIDRHNVPTLERGYQTLLYVSQESLSIHRPFDQHRRRDASLTQASDKRHSLPVPHRGITDQALSARAPTVEPHHIGSDCRLVDKYETGRVKNTVSKPRRDDRPDSNDMHGFSSAMPSPQTNNRRPRSKPRKKVRRGDRTVATKGAEIRMYLTSSV